MKDKLPNFLIVGMAKCGTTSLCQYLSQHPDIFIPQKKEPRFITSQIMRFPMNGPRDHEVESWYVKNYEDYVELFREAHQPVIGEASADTLYYYKDTIPVIKRYFGDPKIIIILRNPVKRAFSAYQHLRRDDRESLSFEEGLEEEDKRIRENWELIYYYKHAGLYAKPVKAFLDSFSNVLVLLNEDLQKYPIDTLRRTFRFLNVNVDQPIDASFRYNQSGIPRFPALHRFLFEENPLKRRLRPVLRTLAPSHSLRTKINTALIAKNLEKIQMARPTENMLKDYFRDDIIELEKIAGLSLKRWL